MNAAQSSSTAQLFAVARAEFLKIWASKIPAVMLAALPIGSYLFVLELYQVERMSDRLHIANAVDALPVLFFATWKTLLFQAAMLTFAAFWTTVDSQYGMIRVACCQPITRAEYLVGKWFGITVHIVLFTLMLIASEVLWTGIYSGMRGVGSGAWIAVGKFTVEVVVFVVGFTSVAIATASFRRTVGAGIVTAIMGFIALAFMTMLPFAVLPPRFVMMRYFTFALGELPNPYSTMGDSSFVRVLSVPDFIRTTVVTTLLFAVPALLYFRRRDVGE